MKIQLVTKSASFERHVKSVFGNKADVLVCRSPQIIEPERSVVWVHAESFGKELPNVVAHLTGAGQIVGVAADHPQLDELLKLSAYGVEAYFNSHMSSTHYRQAYRLLGDGLSWYPPELLQGVLERARRTAPALSPETILPTLTTRERQVAFDVARGFSNKRIAEERCIAERTVKAHLTRIFKKLELPDRMSLAIAVNGWGVDAKAS